LQYPVDIGQGNGKPVNLGFCDEPHTFSTSGTLRAIGRVVKPGQRVIFAEGVLQDAAGRPLATATSSLLVLPR